MSTEWFAAVRDGNDERVGELLAEHPELLFAEGTEEKNALHCAAENGHDKVVARLLSVAPPTLVNERTGWQKLSALDFAASEGHDKVVALLLAAKADLEVERGRDTALFYAVSRGHETVFDQLLAAWPEMIDVVNSGGLTTLHAAVQAGRDKLVGRILALRPEMIDAVTLGGWSVFRDAVNGGHVAIAERLLAIKPEVVFEVSPKKFTMLYYAVQNCTEEFAAKLWRMNPQVLHVADVCSSHTPFHVAVNLHKEDLIELFQWKFSFDEIISAFTILEIDYEERYRPVMERLCEPLFACLNQDVMSTVFEFIGFNPLKRPTKRAHKQLIGHTKTQHQRNGKKKTHTRVHEPCLS